MNTTCDSERWLLRLCRTKFFLRYFRVEQDGAHVATLSPRADGRWTDLTVDDAHYAIHQTSGEGLQLLLEPGEQEIARVKDSVGFDSLYPLEIPGTGDLTLEPRRRRGVDCRLHRDGHEIGVLRSEGFFVRAIVADLPGELSLPVAVFLGYASYLLEPYYRDE